MDEFFKESEFKNIGLVFTTHPERANMKDEDAKNKGLDMQYQRGRIEGVPYYEPWFGEHGQ